MESSERSFGEFKQELLADATTDAFGVYEAWWLANSYFPDRPLSERLAMSERAIRELLAAGLIMLVRDQNDPEGSQIPAEGYGDTLRSWGTWVIGDQRPKAFFWATEAGTQWSKTVGPSLDQPSACP
jgi:hypothetical protein